MAQPLKRRRIAQLSGLKWASDSAVEAAFSEIGRARCFAGGCTFQEDIGTSCGGRGAGPYTVWPYSAYFPFGHG